MRGDHPLQGLEEAPFRREKVGLLPVAVPQGIPRISIGRTEFDLVIWRKTTSQKQSCCTERISGHVFGFMSPSCRDGEHIVRGSQQVPEHNSETTVT